MQSRVLSARVPTDVLHANGGLGRRESQGSVSSAGSLDLVSACRAAALVHGASGRSGDGWEGALEHREYLGLYFPAFVLAGTCLWTPTGAAGARPCLGVCTPAGP